MFQHHWRRNASLRPFERCFRHKSTVQADSEVKEELEFRCLEYIDVQARITQSLQYQACFHASACSESQHARQVHERVVAGTQFTKMQCYGC